VALVQGRLEAENVEDAGSQVSNCAAPEPQTSFWCSFSNSSFLHSPSDSLLSPGGGSLVFPFVAKNIYLYCFQSVTSVKSDSVHDDAESGDHKGRVGAS
jgi:hypothetical protein